MFSRGRKDTQLPAQKCSAYTLLVQQNSDFTNTTALVIQVSKGREFDSRPGEHGFPFFQLKTFTGSVRVLLTSVSLKLKSNYQELGYTSCW